MIRNRSSALMHTVNITKLNHICKSWLDAQSSTLRAHPARTWTHVHSRADTLSIDRTVVGRDLMNRAHDGPTLSLFIKRPSKDYIGATEIFKIFKYTRVCVQFVRWKENLTTALKLRSWTYARYSVGWTFVRSLVSLNVDKTSTNREHILWEEYKCWTALWSLCIVNRFNNWRELFLKGDR